MKTVRYRSSAAIGNIAGADRDSGFDSGALSTSQGVLRFKTTTSGVNGP